VYAAEAIRASIRSKRLTANFPIGSLKGQSHEIFDPGFFFRQTVPLGPLIHGIKGFCI
jgi:hypothetical protein